MRWSQAKKQFESLVAAPLQGRLRVHVTEYSKMSTHVGRGWMTVDGRQVVSVQIPSVFDTNFDFSIDVLDFGAAIRAYLGLSIEQAKNSSDPLIRGFSWLDRRVGKRKLQAARLDDLDKFARTMLAVRYAGENIPMDGLSDILKLD